MFQVQPQRWHKKKICHWGERKGRRERKQKRKEIWEEIEEFGKRQDGRNGKINDRAQSHTVLMVKWCLAHQPKCSLFDIIVSSLTYAKLQLHSGSSQVEMSILP